MQEREMVSTFDDGEADTLPCGLLAAFGQGCDGLAVALHDAGATIALTLSLDELRGMARWTPDDAGDWLWSPVYVAVSLALIGLVSVRVGKAQAAAFGSARPEYLWSSGRPLQLPDALALGRIAARFLAAIEESEARG